MNKEEIKAITDKEDLYDKCENMEQVFDNYYLPLLDIHYKKTYELQNDIKTLLKENEAKEKVIKKQDYVINELENVIVNFIERHTEDYLDWKYDEKIYLAESNILQKLFDTYYDKLKKLKENE